MKYPQLVSMPSEVSNWLEEQLEARGIDSEIYTRYILSLLLAHKLDFIYPEEDFSHSRQNKEGQRPRRNITWGRRTYTDVEQLKRSAAVECLMSAAEQSCEIESLVDELCAKLKAVNKANDDSSNVDKNNADAICEETIGLRKMSPEELAKKYYAAFPPLNSKAGNSYFASNISLALEKWPSDKSSGDLAAAKFANADAFKKVNREPKPLFIEPDTKPTTLRQNMATVRSHGFESRTTLQDTVDFQTDDIYVKFFEAYLLNGICKLVDESLTDSSEEIMEEVSSHIEHISTAWINNEHKWNRYLDVFERDFFSTEANIEELEVNALKEEYQRDEDNPIKDKHYRPRDYMRSQWVSYGNLWDVNYHYENRSNTWSRFSPDVDVKQIVIGPRNMSQASLSNMLLQQDEEFSKADRLDDSTSSDIFSTSIFNTNYGFNYCNNNLWWTRQLNRGLQNNFINYLFDNRIMGLIRENDSMNEKAYLNHRHQLSIITDEEFLNGPFIKKSENLNQRNGDLLQVTSRRMQLSPSSPDDKKMKSPNMYFEPLDVLLKRDAANEINMDSLPDGTSFNVKSDLDLLTFQRSPSGSLFLESESGKVTKYFEYKYQSPTDESMRLPRFGQSFGYQEFKVKYPVSTNDKACQTDCFSYENMFRPPENDTSTPISTAAATSNYLGNEKDENDDISSTCSLLSADGFTSLSELEKLVDTEFDNEWRKFNKFCKHCHLWSNASWLGLKVNIDDREQKKNIWENNEIDQRCFCATKRSSPLITTKQLLQECNDEEDQLLAQIDHYRLFTGLDMFNQNKDVPITERRRHSYVSGASNLWSFATRIEADCLISSCSLPARCSVAL